MNNAAKEKARQLRYKKAALARLNLDTIRDELSEISENCDNVRYFIEDDSETLLAALDGDEEEEYEFKMMFFDLSAKCDRLSEVLYDGYVTEYFDDFLVGVAGNRYELVGYDGYEEDYYSLASYDSEAGTKESGKRLMRLTKNELISTAGQVFGIVMSFLDITSCYDSLKAAFDILREDNTSYLKIIKEIDSVYDAADKDGFYPWDNSTKRFDELVDQLPDRAWLE